MTEARQTPEATAARPAGHRLRGALARLRPLSLRGQLALGSALLAVVAVTLVALISLVAITLTFGGYQRTQLTSQASQLAIALGQGRPASGFGPVSPDDPTRPGRFSRAGGNEVWVMDASGALIVRPLVTRPGASGARDEALVRASLRKTLRGVTTEGPFPGGSPFTLSQRYYATAPIHAQEANGREGPVIGAVALTTPVRAEREGAFARTAATIIGGATLIVAALAAALAMLFARTLIRPLDRLAQAAARMARGDYSARLRVESPRELARVGGSFNAMAVALERDVEELRRQETLRRELIADVSHELATPLTAIQGFTEALQDEVVRDSAQRAETIRTIAREAARLRRLVDQLREVAQIEGGVAALERTEVALPGLVEATLAVVAPEAERRGVTLAAELPPTLPAVAADEDGLTRILLNLLDNALRHAPDNGAVTLTAEDETPGSEGEGARAVRVSIADNGPGIPAGERDRVFDRFYRTDPSRSAETGGSGLGLAIVRALVEAHGGRVRVDASPSGGARFSFTLPVAAPEPEPEAGAGEPERTVDANGLPHDGIKRLAPLLPARRRGGDEDSDRDASV